MVTLTLLASLSRVPINASRCGVTRHGFGAMTMNATLLKLPYKNTVAMLVPLENFCEAFLQSPSGCCDVGDRPSLIALINGETLRLLKCAAIICEVVLGITG